MSKMIRLLVYSYEIVFVKTRYFMQKEKLLLKCYYEIKIKSKQQVNTNEQMALQT